MGKKAAGCGKLDGGSLPRSIFKYDNSHGLRSLARIDTSGAVERGTTISNPALVKSGRKIKRIHSSLFPEPDVGINHQFLITTRYAVIEAKRVETGKDGSEKHAIAPKKIRALNVSLNDVNQMEAKGAEARLDSPVLPVVHLEN